MRKYLLLTAVAVFFLFASCNDKKAKEEVVTEDEQTIVINDTTVYGECGEGTTMNLLELKTSEGKVIKYIIESDSLFSPVKGGLMCGDRIAVIGHKNENDMIADNVINLTTLLGKWSSIDRNFEIQEGGLIKTNASERKRYTKWEIINGNLVLSPDTFSVYSLGPDSLMLENKEGIYAFSRIK